MLPEQNASWPPNTTQSEKVAEWSAWYSGDADQLATFYGAQTGALTKPAQYRGGIAGRLARWWWGQPTPAGEQRSKLHVPLAADICGTSADLLFSEPVRLTSDNEQVTTLLGSLQDKGLDSRLHEAAEVQAALGGVYLRTVWDSEVSDLPWTETAHPDGAIPVWRHGRLNAVTLWSELPKVDNDHTWRLFEHHERGLITYALHRGQVGNVGKAMPVEAHPDTAYLAGIVAAGQAVLENLRVVQPTGLDSMTVVYVPNMLPNRLHRHSPQGRSDLQGVEPMLDALDEAYSSWWRDIRHAKARLHAPAYMIESDGPGLSGSVDLDREVYVPMEGVLAGSHSLSDMIHAQQFAIRVAEHRETCEAWTTRIIESAGYSTQSLSSGTGGAVTAAEVHSHERRSYMTRGKKSRYWTAALHEHLRTQLEVANTILGARTGDGEVRIQFADGVQDSALQLANTAMALRNAEAASVETRVRMVNPDWSEDDVLAEAARILAETGVGEPIPVPEDAGL